MTHPAERVYNAYTGGKSVQENHAQDPLAGLYADAQQAEASARIKVSTLKAACEGKSQCLVHLFATGRYGEAREAMNNLRNLYDDLTAALHEHEQASDWIGRCRERYDP